MTVGEKIKERRLELNLSQDELAKKVGYKSRSSIQKIEAARDLPLKKISIMAKALGVSEDYLAGWSSNDVPIFEPSHIELIDLFSKLTPEQKQTVLSLLRSFQK